MTASALTSTIVSLIIASCMIVDTSHGDESSVPPTAEILLSIGRDANNKYIDTVEDLANQDLFYRLSVGSELVELVEDSSMWTDADAFPDEQDTGNAGYDLDLRAGRAAFALDALFGIDLPRIHKSVSETELTQTKELARLQLDTYSRGVMDVVRSARIGYDVDQLMQEYGPKLVGDSENGSLSLRQHAAFQALLKSFFPLDKRLIDLETIVGRQPFVVNAETRLLEERDDSIRPTGIFQYRFDSGYSGFVYYFEVKDGMIKRVVRDSLE